MANKRKIDPLSIRIIIEIVVMVAVLVLLLVGIGSVWASIGESDDKTDSTADTGASIAETDPPVETTPPDTSPHGVMEAFLAEHNLSYSDYPQFVLDSYQTCSGFFGPGFESRDFLLNYPLKYGQVYNTDISGLDRSNGVPLILQWDERWGYLDYGVSICGIGGCGPTSLSMVAYYLTGNPEYTPVYMMELAKNGHHVIPTGGTDWSLFGTGAVELGFKVDQLPAVERTIAKRLEAGIPVVVNVGPGTFTTTGHYMVLVGYENGMFRINDPNSVAFSSRLWAWSEFADQVRNFWAISLP
jgi:hypothetical protein